MLKLPTVAVIFLFLFAIVGCSTLNLGDVDETPDHRDDMPGPGVFSDDKGESILRWDSNEEKPAVEEKTLANTKAVADPDLSEKNEFELYKHWKEISSDVQSSEEYQEFKLWLEFRRLKQQQ